MSLRTKLHKIENELDRLYEQDSINPRIEELEQEANDIQDELNAIEDRINANVKKREEEQAAIDTARVAEVIDLHRKGKWDLMIEKFGGEFLDRYDIQGNTVISYARENSVQTWEVDDSQKKLRQLLVWTIYNYYVR